MERSISNVEGLSIHHPTRSVMREIEAVRVAFDHRPVANKLRVRARRQRLVEIPNVIDVIVRYEDPTDVLRFDQREYVLQPLFAICGGAGIDDHRLLAEDHHRI